MKTKKKEVKYTKQELKELFWQYIKVCSFDNYSYGGSGAGGSYKDERTIEGFINWLSD
jgi:hypothetical protein